jgi:hypothetical protein
MEDGGHMKYTYIVEVVVVTHLECSSHLEKRIRDLLGPLGESVSASLSLVFEDETEEKEADE